MDVASGAHYEFPQEVWLFLGALQNTRVGIFTKMLSFLVVSVLN